MLRRELSPAWDAKSVRTPPTRGDATSSLKPLYPFDFADFGVGDFDFAAFDLRLA